jgi:LL-diaminopimelate aminotransferase
LKHAAKWRSSRLSQLGSAIFAEVADWKRQAIQAGLDVIDLGIGSPDKPPSDIVRQTLQRAVGREDAYQYPLSRGGEAFRVKASEWFAFRFGVALDPEEEVLALMGSQDGLAHLALAVCNSGDAALVPDPGYPIYAAGLAIAGVKPVYVPLRPENGFLPDLEAVSAADLEGVKFILLNFPSNPVSAVADLAFFERLVAFGKRHGILIVHDLAYSEMAFDGFQPPSILQVPGAIDTAVEFHSLSKSFNMAGSRIGFLAGNREAVGALRDLKANLDYGVFNAVQEAGIAALEEDMSGRRESAGRLYERRRDLFIEALAAEGWTVSKPKATMFVWAPLPVMDWFPSAAEEGGGSADGEQWTSRTFARGLLEQAGVAVIPGSAFGREGEGYVRIALVEDEDKLVEAARRIGRFLRGGSGNGK